MQPASEAAALSASDSTAAVASGETSLAKSNLHESGAADLASAVLLEEKPAEAPPAAATEHQDVTPADISGTKPRRRRSWGDKDSAERSPPREPDSSSSLPVGDAASGGDANASDEPKRSRWGKKPDADTDGAAPKRKRSRWATADEDAADPLKASFYSRSAAA